MDLKALCRQQVPNHGVRAPDGPREDKEEESQRKKEEVKLIINAIITLVEFFRFGHEVVDGEPAVLHQVVVEHKAASDHGSR